MIPAEHLWPIDEMWNYHCARHEFARFKRYVNALEKRYGAPTDVEDFVRKAQLATTRRSARCSRRFRGQPPG